MSGKIFAILPAYNEEVSIGSIVLHTWQNMNRDITTVLKNVKVS